jgi:hypothetical protein
MLHSIILQDSSKVRDLVLSKILEMMMIMVLIIQDKEYLDISRKVKVSSLMNQTILQNLEMSEVSTMSGTKRKGSETTLRSKSRRTTSSHVPGVGLLPQLLPGEDKKSNKAQFQEFYLSMNLVPLLERQKKLYKNQWVYPLGDNTQIQITEGRGSGDLYRQTCEIQLPIFC